MHSVQQYASVMTEYPMMCNSTENTGGIRG